MRVPLVGHLFYFSGSELAQFGFQRFNFRAKHFVHRHLFLHFRATVHDGRVVASAEGTSYLCEWCFRVFMGEVAHQMSRCYDRRLSGFRSQVGEFHVFPLTNEIHDGFHVQLFSRLIHQTGNDALGQVDVDAASTAIAHREGQHGIDHSLQFAHTVRHIFGNVLYHFFGEGGDVLAPQFVVQNVPAQL